jgi:excisionase family DNA binding protein
MSHLNELLTVREVAHWLRVDRKTVYQLLHHAQLPYLRVRWQYRVRRHDLEAWLQQQKERQDADK